MTKADATSTEFSEGNATLLWRTGLMHSPTLTLTAAQLNGLLDAARAEGAARHRERRGLLAWFSRLLHGDPALPITEIYPAKPAVVGTMPVPSLAPAPIVDGAPAPAGLTVSESIEASAGDGEAPALPMVAPIEVDPELQAKIRALYAPEA